MSSFKTFVQYEKISRIWGKIRTSVLDPSLGTFQMKIGHWIYRTVSFKLKIIFE